MPKKFTVKVTETKMRTLVLEVEADDEESAIAAALAESRDTQDADWDLLDDAINEDAAVVAGE